MPGLLKKMKALERANENLNFENTKLEEKVEKLEEKIEKLQKKVEKLQALNKRLVEKKEKMEMKMWFALAIATLFCSSGVGPFVISGCGVAQNSCVSCDTKPSSSQSVSSTNGAGGAMLGPSFYSTKNTLMAPFFDSDHYTNELQRKLTKINPSCILRPTCTSPKCGSSHAHNQLHFPSEIQLHYMHACMVSHSSPTTYMSKRIQGHSSNYSYLVLSFSTQQQTSFSDYTCTQTSDLCSQILPSPSFISPGCCGLAPLSSLLFMYSGTPPFGLAFAETQDS
ncbi:tumor susceptibility gene 101 protein [Striga asiatica]|uniref:Tumor susceptibility gene 101 protein n=1 Tax=Striga asiatica TaxID=4170 RepID=A0A5A7PSL7_STRAF|nr:tumor susceptibility gene 101 protein [Striga asiatica]